MSKLFFLLAAVVAVVGGLTVAWTVNHQKFRQRDVYFADMGIDREVTAENYAAYRRKFQSDRIAKAETPGGRDHDFGVMKRQETGEHTFVIKNVGDAPMELSLGATTCKCTLGELADGVLDPGEQTDVHLTWTVKTASKDFGQSAEIRTNAPDDPAIRFEISGLVVGDFQTAPENVTFGEVPAGEPFEFDFNVYNFSDRDVSLGEPAFAAEQFAELADFEIESSSPEPESEFATARQAFRVRARVDGGLPQGATSSQIRIPLVPVSGDSGAGEVGGVRVLTLNVGGRVVGALGMIANARIRDVKGGYLYDFGRIATADDGTLDPDALVANMLITLKGDQFADAKLRVASIEPEGVIKAELVDTNARRSTRLFKLNVELVPGDDPVVRLGRNKGDYGLIRIESDNPKVSGMKIGIKFALDGR